MRKVVETTPKLHIITRGKKIYPELLSLHLNSDAPEDIYALGDLSILTKPLSALFCSTRCPADLFLPTYDLAQRLRDSGDTIISGFHSPLEKDCLEILLRGKQPIIICPARSISTMRIPLEWRSHIDNNRLLLLSPFPPQKHITRPHLAQYRNRFAAALSTAIYIVHASPGSKTMKLSKEILSWKKTIYTFDHSSNQPLISSDAKLIHVGEKVGKQVKDS